MNLISNYFDYLLNSCYEEDYDVLYWNHDYKYEYTFAEWYFLYRKRFKLTQIDLRIRNKNNLIIYKHTPNKLIIGADIYNYK